MQELVDEFSEPGELVGYVCSGEFASANPCLELPSDCKLLGFKIFVERFAACTDALTETYAGQILKDKSEIWVLMMCWKCIGQRFEYWTSCDQEKGCDRE